MSQVRKFAIAFMAIAFLGFVDAAFLTYAHYTNLVPPCTFLSGCEQVTTSAYSAIYGVPVAFLGTLYYLVAFLTAVYCFEQKDDAMLKRLSWFTLLGLIASAWFVFLQLFVIHAICIYCMTSAATSTALFVAGMIYLLRKHADEPVRE